jgi:hypothetical protein
VTSTDRDRQAGKSPRSTRSWRRCRTHLGPGRLFLGTSGRTRSTRGDCPAGPPTLSPVSHSPPVTRTTARYVRWAGHQTTAVTASCRDRLRIPHAQPPHPRLVRHAPGPPRQRDLPCPRKTPQQHSHACHGQPRPAQPPARAHRSPETLHPGQRDQPEKRVEGTRRRIVQAQAPTMPRTVHTPSAEQHRQQPRDHHPGSSRQQPGPLPATRAHWRSGPSAGPARPRARYRPPPPPPRGGGPAPAPLLIHPDEHTAKPYDQGLTVAQAGPVGSIQGTCTTAR